MLRNLEFLSVDSASLYCLHKLGLSCFSLRFELFKKQNLDALVRLPIVLRHQLLLEHLVREHQTVVAFKLGVRFLLLRVGAFLVLNVVLNLGLRKLEPVLLCDFFVLFSL